MYHEMALCVLQVQSLINKLLSAFYDEGTSSNGRTLTMRKKRERERARCLAVEGEWKHHVQREETM